MREGLPDIQLRAYNCTPDKVFVRVPNERGRWVLTDRCVVEVTCPICGALKGVPCWRTYTPARGELHARRDGRYYWAGTHCDRRRRYQRTYGPGHAARNPNGAKPRLRPEDLLSASERLPRGAAP